MNFVVRQPAPPAMDADAASKAEASDSGIAALSPEPDLLRDPLRRRVLMLLHAITAEDARGNAEAGLAFEISLRAAAVHSLRALASDLAKYAAFCQANGLIGVPARPTTILGYVDQLQAEKYAYASVARQLASIAKVHRILGLEPPTASPAVRARLREYRRVMGVRQVQARPLRLRGEGGLDADPGRSLCLENLLAACDGSLIGLRDAALLSTAYDAGLRVSEVTAAEVQHLRHDRKTGEGKLFLPHSKTDQDKAGQWAWLSAATMRLLDRWKKAAAISQGPLFRRVRVGTSRKTGAVTVERVGTERLTTEGVAHIIRQTIVRAVIQGFVDLDGQALKKALQTVSTHSFRVGVTQDLYAAGADTNAILQSLRWRSASTALGYVRALATDKGATATLLRTRRKVESTQVRPPATAD